MKNPSAPFGEYAPDAASRAILALTAALPNNWLGLRLAILFRRAITTGLAKQGTDAGLDVKRWGLAMRLHPLDNGCEKNLLFTPQMYEPEELAELESEIDRAKSAGRTFTFLDIGANVGLFSLFVAAKAGSVARILAFEPEPGNMARLTFNVSSNQQLPVEPLAMALGDEEGEVAIALNRRDRGGTRAHKVSADDSADTVRVPCRPLLTVLREKGIATIDAMKIDVEGMEDLVLAPFFRDAPEALWPTMILIEDSRHEWRTDLFTVFAAKGYTITTRSKQNVVLRRRNYFS